MKDSDKRAIEGIGSKEEFCIFLNNLAENYKHNSDSWNSKSIDEYLLAIERWITDMEGYYVNNGLPVPQNIDWGVLASIFIAGKFYE